MGKTSSFTIGRVTGVHGLAGNLKVWSYAESVESFCPGNSVLLKSGDDEGSVYTILKASPHKKGILLVLEGIDNRNLAEDLIGCDILIDRDQLEEPEEGSWFWEDLIGLTVVDHLKGQIGKVQQIFPTGADDILVVKDGKQETLVPMNSRFVETVDLENSLLKTTLPEEF